ncbi:hypothetical protein KY285_020904 [Solanum tuberosum]|nr:hypothetical protein KY285_020904 [Solanum tuberosum]
MKMFQESKKRLAVSYNTLATEGVTGIVVNVKQLQKYEDCICSIDCDCNSCLYGCIRSIDCHCYFCFDEVMEKSNALNDSIKIEAEKRTIEAISIAPLQIQKMAKIKFIMTTVKVEIAGKTSVYFLAHELNLQQIGEVFWVSRRVSRYVVMNEKLKEMKLRVASHLFDEMSERNHVRIVHVFVGIKTKLSLELVGNGLVVPIWDPGISLKTLKLTGHTSNVREILIDMTSMVCLHRSSDNINRVWDTGWQWFMHSPVVHIDSICSVATIPTYSHVYSGTRSLSLHVTTSSSKKIMLFWSSILPLTLHDDSKRIATIYLSIHYWSVDGCTIRKASQRRGSVMARNLSTARVKAYLAEQHVCRQCQPWSFGFILLVAIYSGAFNFGNRLKDGKATWLQITRTGLQVNWSTKTEVKLGAFSLGTFWKVEYARGTSIVDVVGLHILLSNTNDSAKLRDGAATVRTMVYGLYLTFDPGGMSIGLEKEAAGLHPIKIKHFNILHQHTCSSQDM